MSAVVEWRWALDERLRYVDSTAGVTDLLGYSQDEVLGQSVLALVPPWEVARARVQFTVDAAALGVEGQLMAFRHKAGHARWLEVLGVAEAGPRGAVRGWHGVTRCAQPAAQGAADPLGWQHAALAHDLGNLLSPLLGWSELLLRGTLPPADRLRRTLESIRAAARDSVDLVQRMLALNSRQPTELRELRLNDVVHAGAERLRQTLTAGSRLELRLADDLPPVLGDAGQLAQALLNLVLNAQQAARGPVTVTVTTRLATELDCDGQRGGPAAARECVELSVRDNGPGMDPATRARVGEPGFTTKPRGHGLGLYSVHETAARCGGVLACDSAPGQGTTFRLRLPALIAGATPAADASLAPADRALAGLVLVVSDDPRLRCYLACTLAQAGHVLLSARTAAQAQALARRHGGEIRLVVADLPCEEAALATVLPRVPRIVTASPGQPRRWEAGQVVLPKPVGRPELLRAAAQLLAGGGRAA